MRSLLLCILALLPLASCQRCPLGWDMYAAGDTCVILKMNSKKNFHEAQTECKAFDAVTDMVVIKDNAMNTWLTSLIQNTNERFLIGLHDQGAEDTFVWVNGENLDLQSQNPNWNSGEPNNWGNGEDCVQLMTSGKWNDIACSATNYFICQRPNDIPLDCDVDNGWKVGVDTCLKYYDSGKTWVDARTYCQARDADLVQSNTTDEQSALLATSVDGQWNTVWIGLTDKDNSQGQYSWVDGTNLGTANTNWATNQPDNQYHNNGGNCVVVLDSPRNGKWTTSACTNNQRFVCEKPKGTCAPGWRIHGGQCYNFYTNTPMTWLAAKHTCEAHGAFLVSILSEDENSFLMTQFSDLGDLGVDRLWMGASDSKTDGTFEWSDGVQMTFDKWLSSPPTNTQNTDCGYFDTSDSDGKWKTGNCYEILPFICKIKVGEKVWPIDPNTAVGKCAPGWNLFNGNCYFFDTTLVAYDTARDSCVAKQSTLTSILDADEQSYLSMRTYTFQVFLWIGLNDKDQQGTFVWEDGSTYGFNYWAPNQPDHYNNNEKCVHFRYGETEEGMWNDLPCGNVQAGYICKAKAECETLHTVVSDDTYNYRYHPSVANVERIEFEVKISNDAHIALTTTSPLVDDNQALYEIVIGGWSNTKSAIRRCKQCTNVAEVTTANYLDANEFRGFWITFDLNTGVLEVGKKNEPNFMTWTDPNPLDVKYVGYSGWNQAGEFRFCNLYAGVVSTIKPPPTPAFNDRCGIGWEYDATSKQCYLFKTGDLRTWDDAREQCRLGGGDLVSITEISEQTYLNARLALSSVSAVWIGANDKLREGGWEWSNGAPFKYINWAGGEPNNYGNTGEHCAELYLNSGEWNDAKCSNSRGYVCKKNGYLVSHFSAYPNMFLDISNYISTSNMYAESCAIGCVYMTFPSQCLSFNYEPSTKTCTLLDSTKDNSGGLTSSTTKTYYQLRSDAPPPYVAPTLPPNYRCQTGWQGYGDNCFQAQQGLASWSDARQNCRQLGADLPSIANENENNFIVSLMIQEPAPDGVTSYWTGLNDLQAVMSFEWSDDSPVLYTNWNANEPNNYNGNNEDCVESYTNGFWNDDECSVQNRYLCKMPKEDLPPTQYPITPSGCDQGWVPYEASCYKIEDQDLATWEDALTACQADGASLAVVNDRYDQAMISSQLALQPFYRKFWIGLHDRNTKGVYEWLGGRTFDYDNWGKGEPDSTKGSCVYALPAVGAGLWMVGFCNSTMNYVCERGRDGYTTSRITTMAVTQPSNTGCATGWTGYGSHCYKAYEPSPKVNFADAQDFCGRLGADLASFHHKEEEEYFVQESGITSNDAYWIGLHDMLSEGGFEWTDGSSVGYTNWAPNEPNDAGASGEDCTEMFFNGHGWNDIPCVDYKRNVVCMLPKGQMPATTLPPVTPQKCPTGEDGFFVFNHYCYYLSPEGDQQGWSEAEDDCHTRGAHLASIHGQDEQDYLFGLVNGANRGGFWIGLREFTKNGIYRWSDNSSLDYDAWVSGEPNDYNGEEECVEMYSWKDSQTGGSWNDQNCGNLRNFICKKNFDSVGPITHKPTPAPEGYCPQHSVRFLNRCYIFFGLEEGSKTTWRNASRACKEIPQGELATIHSQAVQAMLTGYLDLFNFNIWIGLSDITTNHQFQWVDGTVVDYTNWNAGEPNEAGGEEDCVEMYYGWNQAGQWNDKSCDQINGYVCQAKPDTSNNPPLTPLNLCTPGYSYWPKTGGCFKILSEKVEFSDAVEACQALGSEVNLASLNDPYEAAFADGLMVEAAANDDGVIVEEKPLWLGMVDDKIAGEYRWLDNWPIYYTKWDTSEPSKGAGEGCVAMAFNGKWDDTNCKNKYGALCKYSLVPVPTHHPEQPGTCPDDWEPYGGYCLLFPTADSESLSQFEAQGECSKLGADLVTIRTKVENEFVRKTVRAIRTDSVWIGLYRSDEGGFQWQDFEPVSFTFWNDGEPTMTWDGQHENCVEMYTDTGRWNDNSCSRLRPYICKKPKTPHSTKKPTPVPSLPTTNSQLPTNNSQLPPTNSQLPTNNSQLPTTNSKQTPAPVNQGLDTGGIVGIVLGVLVVGLIVFVVAFFLMTRNKAQKGPVTSTNPVGFENVGFDNSLYSSNLEESREPRITGLPEKADKPEEASNA